MVNPMLWEDEELELHKNGDRQGTKFLRDGIDYYFPDYICIFSNKKNKVTFNLLVEDVLPNSSKMVVDADEKSVCVKFCVIKLDPNEARHYAFMAKLPVGTIEEGAELHIMATKVVLKIPFLPDGDLSWFLCGLTDSQLQKKTVEKYQMRIEDTSFETEDSSSGSDNEEEGWPTTEF